MIERQELHLRKLLSAYADAACWREYGTTEMMQKEKECADAIVAYVNLMLGERK